MMRRGEDGLQMRAETSIYDIWRGDPLNRQLARVRNEPLQVCSDGIIWEILWGFGKTRRIGFFSL
jgi:hypothetical protein